LEKLLIRIDEGRARPEDIDTLDSVAGGMQGNTICVLADAAAMPVRSFIAKFRSEFEEHIYTGGCNLGESGRDVA